MIMSRLDINTVRCEALFVSALQRSDDPGLDEVRRAISTTVRRLGSRGCAAQVAQEYGDHPDVAAMRMRWARSLVESGFLGPRHAGKPDAGNPDAGDPDAGDPDNPPASRENRTHVRGPERIRQAA
jgi:hypothetical protein